MWFFENLLPVKIPQYPRNTRVTIFDYSTRRSGCTAWVNVYPPAPSLQLGHQPDGRLGNERRAYVTGCIAAIRWWRSHLVEDPIQVSQEDLGASVLLPFGYRLISGLR